MKKTTSNNPPMSERIKAYWSLRSSTFKTTRANELDDSEIGKRWLDILYHYFPADKQSLNILDIGTGAGYFSILLAEQGYHTTGIDLTPDMISAAKDLAKQRNSTAHFQVMDAMNLDFPDQSFDVIVTRNLTWTLPDIPRAYQDWYRVLSANGVLLNFDAEYGNNVRYEKKHSLSVSQDTPYGHRPISDKMWQENADITLSMEASRQTRPEWDLKLLSQCGFSRSGSDLQAGKKVMKEWDQIHSPMFLIWAYK